MERLDDTNKVFVAFIDDLQEAIDKNEASQAPVLGWSKVCHTKLSLMDQKMRISQFSYSLTGDFLLFSL